MLITVIKRLSLEITQTMEIIKAYQIQQICSFDQKLPKLSASLFSDERGEKSNHHKVCRLPVFYP